ncbi:MAG: MMPL family transporter [bacterium]|nr:MMPL family transporter [bacterium]
MVAVALFLLAGSLTPLGRLHFDNSPAMWFAQDDPALRDYRQLTELFGDNEYLLVGIEAREGDRDLFTADAFDLIYQLSEFLAQHTHVTKVRSLKDYRFFKRRGGLNYVTRLVAETPEAFDGSDEAMAKARTRIAEETSTHGSLITDDLRHTLILARVKYIEGHGDHHIKLVGDLRSFVADNDFDRSGFKLHLTGHPVGNEAFQAAIIKDQKLSFPLMLLIIVVILLGLFHTPLGVVLPLVVILGSVLLSMGLTGLLGWPINMLNAALAIILMAIGVGDSIHIMVEFYHVRNQGQDARAAAITASETMFMPCLNTTLTTMLGFLAISFSSLVPIREFGVIAAWGVAMAFLLSFTLLPALLSYNRGTPALAKRIVQDNPIARILKGVARLVHTRRKAILLLFATVTLISFYGALEIRTDSNMPRFLKGDTPLARDAKYFSQHYSGGVFLEYIVDTGAGAGSAGNMIADPDFLRRVGIFQEWLQARPESGRVFSIVNMIESLHKALRHDDQDSDLIPDSRDRLQKYINFYTYMGGSENLSDLKTFDGRYFRISQRIGFSPSDELLQFVAKAQERLARDLPEVSVKVTGVPVLFANLNRHVNSGAVKAITLSVVMISICLLLLLRSWRYGLLALIPSLLPMLVAAGLMGFSGLQLNFATMVIISVTLGIAVDNAIHIVSRYASHRRQQRLSHYEAMDLAIWESGRALSYTALVLFLGFSILVTSSFVPNMQLGFFSALILLLALITSLILLPAIVFYLTEPEAGRT